MRDHTEHTAAAAFIGGLTVGVVAGLLLTPQAGAGIRASIRDYVGEVVDDLFEAALHSGRIYLEDMVERGKEFVEHTVEEVLEPARNIGVLR